MPLFNVTFTDVATERTVTFDVDSAEEANAQARASFARLGQEWDGKVSSPPEPPPTVADIDNVDHPAYASFLPPSEPEPEAPAPSDEE